MKKNTNILLVEDSKMDVALTLDAFREAHLANNIHVAHNGEEALNFLFGNGKYSNREAFPLPNIILLDIKLPGKNGHEVLKIIKATPEIKRIPVIILTSSKEEADRALSYDHGANSYLVKPISFEGFLEVVRKVTDYWIYLNIDPPLHEMH